MNFDDINIGLSSYCNKLFLTRGLNRKPYLGFLLSVAAGIIMLTPVFPFITISGLRFNSLLCSDSSVNSPNEPLIVC